MRFEFLRSVTFGHYIPGSSAIHGLDPRAKIAAAIIAFTALILCRSLLLIVIALAALLAAAACARVSVRHVLRGIRPVLPFLVFLAVLQALVMPRAELGPMLIRWWRISLSMGDLAAAAALILRFCALISAFGLFSSVTGTSELAHGVELILAPLARLKFPAHEAAMVLSIALRFVPLLAMEAEHIVKAQASRGADFGRGRGGPVARARRMLPLYVPLFLSALRRAEALALAMEARCYTGGAGRTAPAGYRMRWTDAAAMLVVLAASAGFILANRLDPDRVVITALFGAG